MGKGEAAGAWPLQAVVVEDEIAAWLREFAACAGAKGYVVGLSGGIDSACTAALCRRAVGNRVLAALLPCHSEAEDTALGRLVADAFDIETVTVDLSAAYDALVDHLPANLAPMAAANLKPRLRMAALYALAQTRGYLVAGTGNKSEIQVGYFTKYGDGGVDLEPLGDLYKHEVRDLAYALGVPQVVINRPPSAGLWAGQTDEGELGMTYGDLDAALAAIEAGDTASIDPARLSRVQALVARSAHKRALAPVCPVRRRSVVAIPGSPATAGRRASPEGAALSTPDRPETASSLANDTRTSQ